MRPPLLLSANQFSDTFAAAPLPNVPFPLAIERERQHDASSNHLARIEECARRLSPWQRVLNWKTSDAGIEVMFERFVGLTFDAWTASLRKHQRCLPL
ncbi:MAG: hypothetical protein JNG84_14740, partial [Archangium sp.]|nr:hypothetical protein [Archangium sp.]